MTIDMRKRWTPAPIRFASVVSRRAVRGWTAPVRRQVAKLLRRTYYLNPDVARPAIIYMNSIGPDGRRVESWVNLDHLHRVQVARAMQFKHLLPEECRS